MVNASEAIKKIAINLTFFLNFDGNGRDGCTRRTRIPATAAIHKTSLINTVGSQRNVVTF
jgi:hypothetical protein